MITILSLFDDKLLDDRQPWLDGIQFPGIEGSFSVYAPKAEPWIQLIALFLMQIGIQSVFAAIIYKVIVKNRGAQFTYIFGYGVVIPLICYIPFVIIEFLAIRSRVVRLALVTAPNLIVFRCLEAMYGTSPSVVETSLGHYVAYYTSLFDFYWNPDTKARQKITLGDLVGRLYRIKAHYVLVSLILSYLLHYDFKPFPSTIALDSYHLSTELFTPGQLLNNYLYALLIFFTLALGWNIAAFSFNLQGFRTVIPFHNPLFTSKSPTDFWGKKWNMTIHAFLKRGAFQPVKNMGFSTYLAVLAAFIASGLLHDYAWAILFISTSHDYDSSGECVGRCWYPLPGKQTLFFLWCGVTMLAEKYFSNFGLIKWMSCKLPTFIVSTFVIMTVLPIAHWYVGDWIVGEYFHDFSLGLFKITLNVDP